MSSPFRFWDGGNFTEQKKVENHEKATGGMGPRLFFILY